MGNCPFFCGAGRTARRSACPVGKRRENSWYPPHCLRKKKNRVASDASDAYFRAPYFPSLASLPSLVGLHCVLFNHRHHPPSVFFVKSGSSILFAKEMAQVLPLHLRIKIPLLYTDMDVPKCSAFLKKSKKSPSKDCSSEGPVHYSSSVSSSLGSASKNAQHF